MQTADGGKGIARPHRDTGFVTWMERLFAQEIANVEARNTLLLLIADIADGPGEEREAVKAAVPSLLHLQDDEHPSIRWAAGELVRICAVPTV